MNYFRQNQDEMRRVIQTEVDVSLEKDGYILVGKVDLLMGGDGKLELLDFKTSPRPTTAPSFSPPTSASSAPTPIFWSGGTGAGDRLLLYWTAEPEKEKALMAFPYRPERMAAEGKHFDGVVSQILAARFRGEATARGRDLPRSATSAATVHRRELSGWRTKCEQDYRGCCAGEVTEEVGTNSPFASSGPSCLNFKLPVESHPQAQPL